MRKFGIIITLLILMGCADEFSSGDSLDVSNGITGTGGSTARFTIVKDYDFLYVVNNKELKAFDISDVEDPTLTSSTNLGTGIETIFGFQDNLFIGSQTGMDIYSISADGSPVYVSGFQHTTACDPVIANGNFAYVTIRDGVGCNNWMFEVNQLITLEITDIRSPIALSTQQMINPRGLTFFQGDLYVGEGESGMKRFSLKDPANPQTFNFYPEIAANDMIGLDSDSILIVTGSDGVYQFGPKPDTVIVNSDTLFYSIEQYSKLE